MVDIRLVSRDQYDIHLDVKVKMAQTSHREGRMKRLDASDSLAVYFAVSRVRRQYEFYIRLHSYVSAKSFE